MNTGTYSASEASQILVARYRGLLERGRTQGQAFENCVRYFNLRSFDKAFAVLLQVGAPVDELEASDWPQGYPVSDADHRTLQGAAEREAQVSLPPVAAGITG